MVKGLKGFHIFGIVVLAIIALLAFLFATGQMSVVSVDGSKKCGADVKKLCCNKKALEAAKMHPDAIKMKCGACDCSKEGFVKNVGICHDSSVRNCGKGDRENPPAGLSY